MVHISGVMPAGSYVTITRNPTLPGQEEFLSLETSCIPGTLAIVPKYCLIVGYVPMLKFMFPGVRIRKLKKTGGE